MRVKITTCPECGDEKVYPAMPDFMLEGKCFKCNVKFKIREEERTGWRNGLDITKGMIGPP